MELEGKLMTNRLSHLESGHYTARNEDGKLIEGDQEGVTYEKETTITEKEVEAAVHTIKRFYTQQTQCSEEVMTNADKIRSMGDQELGSFLCNLMKNGCKMCPSQKQEYCEDDIMLWMEEEYGKNGYGDYKYLTVNKTET